ncbi:MAG: NADH-quinone oxidoreductase subunit N [Deinococcaceae bacterium]
MIQFPDVALGPLLPLMILLITAIFATLGGLYTSRTFTAYVGVGGLVLTLLSLFSLWGKNETAFAGSLRADNYALIFSGIMVIGTLLCALVSLDTAKKSRLNFVEFDAILYYGLSGCVLIAFAGDLITLLIGVEVMSLATYVLATFQASKRAEEAGLKYFLLGSIGSAILIYGMALVFGATGHFDFAGIASAISAQGFSNTVILVAGALLMLAGFSFKVGLVPFHQWTPDVYAGSPTLVTLFMSVVVKTAAFAGFIRIFGEVLAGVSGWQVPVQILAGVTMLLGNMAALRQKELKRMLAYSAIAHSGYLVLGVLATVNIKAGPMFAAFYLLTYTAMNAGVFAAIGALQKDDRGVTLDDLKGLYHKKPLYAVPLALFWVSLAGLPPLGGFMAKYGLFTAAFYARNEILVLVALVSSMYALVYYLRPMVLMFVQPKEGVTETYEIQPFSGLVIGISVIGLCLLGLFPAWFYNSIF